MRTKDVQIKPGSIQMRRWSEIEISTINQSINLI